MGAGQFEDIAEHGFLVGDVLNAQIFRQAFLVELLFEPRMGQKALDLAAKKEQSVHIIIVEGLDAKNIPGSEHGMAGAVPDHKGEHPPQPGGQLLAPLLIAMEQNLGIGFGGKGMARRHQLGAQVLEIVNLTVKNHDQIAVLIEHGLLAALQVNDGQPAVAQGHLIVHIIALAVRAAVGDQVRHSLDDFAGGFGVMAALGKAGNSTHRLTLPSCTGFSPLSLCCHSIWRSCGNNSTDCAGTRATVSGSGPLCSRADGRIFPAF